MHTTNVEIMSDLLYMFSGFKSLLIINW